MLPTQAFRTDRWRDMDADVALEAGRIVHDSKLPLSDLSVHLVLQDGKLTRNLCASEWPAAPSIPPYTAGRLGRDR